MTCTLGVYNAVNHNGFVNYDDDVYVTANRHVQSGLSSSTLGWAFTSFDAANWHPLTWISHALDYQIFKLNPAGHHYISLLLHCANVVLLFLLLVDATEADLAVARCGCDFCGASAQRGIGGMDRRAQERAQHAVPAARAEGLPDATRANPSLATIPRSYFVLFACGLMAKPQVITLPFLLSAMGLLAAASNAVRFAQRLEGGENFPGSLSWLLLEKIPLLALSAASAVVTIAAQHVRRRGAIGNRVSGSRANRKCRRRLLRLRRQNVLAVAAGGDVSASGRLAAGVANCPGGVLRNRRYGSCVLHRRRNATWQWDGSGIWERSSRWLAWCKLDSRRPRIATCTCP